MKRIKFLPKRQTVVFSVVVLLCITVGVMGSAENPREKSGEWETLCVGDRGDEVWRVQERLTTLGYYRGECSGVFDLSTAEAVRRFQLAEGLTADGVAGDAELEALGVYAETEGKKLTLGASGQEVLRLQQILYRLDYYHGSLTGRFGSLTAEAVRDFQRRNGLPVTGCADAATLYLLGLTGDAERECDGGERWKQTMLARLIESGAKDRSFAAQTALAAVALNRQKSENLTLPAAVFLILREIDPTATLSPAVSPASLRAARDALDGLDPTSGAHHVSASGKGLLLLDGLGFE